jgi:hypothetical protein
MYFGGPVKATRDRGNLISVFNCWKTEDDADAPAIDSKRLAGKRGRDRTYYARYWYCPESPI